MPSRAAGVALQETGNLIIIPAASAATASRCPSIRKTSRSGRADLSAVGAEVQKCAQARSWTEASALELTGKVSDACQACHDKYRNTPKEPEDRCMVTAAAAPAARSNGLTPRVTDITMAEYFAPLRACSSTCRSSRSSIALRESQYVMPWVFVSHVVSMCMFAGTILMMDLRLLGVGHMQTPFSQVQRRLFPWQIAAMVVSSSTGLALVWGNPMNYVTNIIFWVKMVAMGIAGLNAIAFHFITEYTVIDWDAGQDPAVRRQDSPGGSASSSG